MEFRLLRNAENIHIIEPQGKLDLLQSTRLKNLVMKMIEDKIESFIFNLEKVTVIDSTGIGALINLSSTLRKLKLNLAITNMSKPVKKAMELQNLASYFPITSSLREAVDLIHSEMSKTLPDNPPFIPVPKEKPHRYQ
jgi:anti-sigma B factor antagonist